MNSENSQISDENLENTTIAEKKYSESSESSENEVSTTTNEAQGKTETSTHAAENEVEVLFLDPAPQTTYKTDGYEIDIIHSMTVGDILISTLLSVLIIAVLLSRLLGGRR